MECRRVESLLDKVCKESCLKECLIEGLSWRAARVAPTKLSDGLFCHC